MKSFHISDPESLPDPLRALRADGLIVYCTEDVQPQRLLSQLAECHPGVPVIGATSFQGVFSPQGFSRGCAVLAWEAGDGMQLATASAACSATDARAAASAAARQVAAGLGQVPQMLLLHGTPGFEERILAGLRDAFDSPVPVYGGSAADDAVAEHWRVFEGTTVHREGFAIAGMCASHPPRGAFLAGYLPTDHSGRVTGADGRRVHTIDGQPASEVYNRWTGGSLAMARRLGDPVFARTAMAPVARIVGEAMGMPRRLISHVYDADLQSGTLTFFSEFAEGDEITLMACSEEQLITRMGRTASRALGRSRARLSGGLFVYCAGSLGEVLPRAPEIAEQFADAVGDVPFVGVATFGEQGWFFDRRESRHGNLMCSAVLFDRA